jgi:hypothetical protein
MGEFVLGELGLSAGQFCPYEEPSSAIKQTADKRLLNPDIPLKTQMPIYDYWLLIGGYAAPCGQL